MNIKLIIIELIMLLGLTGCREENIPELPAGPPITIEFELLNSNGEPDTVFQQGENFEFSYTFINHTNDTLMYFQDMKDSTYYYFSRVFKIETNTMIDMGLPCVSLGCLEVNGRYIYLGEKTYKIPWKSSTDVIYDIDPYCFCRGNNLDYLPKGNYYTGFESGFEFKVNGEAYIKEEHFEIFFEIK